MDIYLTALTFSCLLALFLSRTQRGVGLSGQQTIRRTPTFFHAFLILLPLILVEVFRWDVGVDSLFGGTYHTAYRYAYYKINSRSFEWGFYMLNRIMAFIKLPFYWYLFTISILYMVGISYGIYKGSVSPVLSVLVFVLIFSYFDSFSALRQALSQAICLSAVSRWMSHEEPVSTWRQDITFLLSIILASLMHTIALLYIPIFLLSRRNIGLKNLIILTLLLILCSPLLQPVFQRIGNLVKDGYYETSGFAVSYMLLSLLIFLACLWKYYSIISLNPRACLLINHALLTFILMLNSSALVLPYRIYDALKICYILTVPYIVKCSKVKNWGYLIGAALLIVIGIFYYNGMYLNENVFAEYHSVFENWSYYTSLY